MEENARRYMNATRALGPTEPAASRSCCGPLMGAVIYKEHDGLQQVL